MSVIFASEPATFEHVVNVVTQPRDTFGVFGVGGVNLGESVFSDDHTWVVVFLLNPS